jgi:hypothetical protein
VKKANKDTKIVMGSVLGGIIGICTLTLILSLRKHKDTSLNSLGTVVSHLSELFEKPKTGEPAITKELGEKLQVHESTLLEVVDWVITGINIWKKFKG